MLDRTIQPAIRNLERFEIQRPECIVMPNGIPVYILDAGSTDVVRIDVVMGGGRWHQSQPLQALFTNRMLREGSASYTGAAIAERRGSHRPYSGRGRPTAPCRPPSAALPAPPLSHGRLRR